QDRSRRTASFAAPFRETEQLRSRRVPDRRRKCEHTFVTSDGSPIRRLRAALRAGDLLRVRGVAAELPYISLPGALLILELIESQDERGFEPAAVRWAGRLALEAPGLTLAQLHLAVEALDRLPDDEAKATLRALARRAKARPAEGARPHTPPHPGRRYA